MNTDIIRQIRGYSETQARDIGLTLDDLRDEIEDLGENPVDFVSKAIQEHRKKLQRLKELQNSYVVKFFALLPGDIEWYMQNNNTLSIYLLVDTLSISDENDPLLKELQTILEEVSGVYVHVRFNEDGYDSWEFIVRDNKEKIFIEFRDYDILVRESNFKLKSHYSMS